MLYMLRFLLYLNSKYCIAIEFVAIELQNTIFIVDISIYSELSKSYCDVFIYSALQTVKCNGLNYRKCIPKDVMLT